MMIYDIEKGYVIFLKRFIGNLEKAWEMAYLHAEGSSVY